MFKNRLRRRLADFFFAYTDYITVESQLFARPIISKALPLKCLPNMNLELYYLPLT